mmetsp:Transcript_90514/g.235851  ORF Transcript_90514/g.235851 Transcript_90514/m.235851 type:complete len:116 (-) Transcript_90514:6-353(-)
MPSASVPSTRASAMEAEASAEPALSKRSGGSKAADAAAAAAAGGLGKWAVPRGAVGQRKIGMWVSPGNMLRSTCAVSICSGADAAMAIESGRWVRTDPLSGPRAQDGRAEWGRGA